MNYKHPHRTNMFQQTSDYFRALSSKGWIWIFCKVIVCEKWLKNHCWKCLQNAPATGTGDIPIMVLHDPGLSTQQDSLWIKLSKKPKWHDWPKVTKSAQTNQNLPMNTIDSSILANKVPYFPNMCVFSCWLQEAQISKKTVCSSLLTRNECVCWVSS